MLEEKSIKKHVAIIHAYSLMSILQRKVVNVLLYEALNQHDDSINCKSVSIECRIPFSTVCKSIKFNSNNTQYVKEAIDDLASIKIEWNLLKDKFPTNISFLNLRILHGPPTFYQDRTVNFSFHKLFIDLLKNPSIYGKIDLDVQSDFDSKYSHSLYENSTRFVNLKKNKIIQLKTLRKLLGVSENKYHNMREFNRNVLYPSIEEVNDRADFNLDLKNIKTGKKISAFELSVSSKKKGNLITSIEAIQENRATVCDEMSKIFCKLNTTLLENILANYSDDYILEKINYIKKYAKKENSGFFPIPYFISALRNDYKESQQDAVETSLPKASKNEWESKFNDLQSDLNHWKKMMEYANSSENSNMKCTIEEVIKKCEISLEQHLSTKNQDEIEL